MASVWIVHRDARRRAALARLAGLGRDVLSGDPADPAFGSAARPRVVLLGLAGDFEAELEFAHRSAPRLPGVRWILLCDPADRADAERLFDSIAAERMVYPPPASALRGSIRAALRARPAESLADRRRRDTASASFSRHFADLELPDLLRALDPRLAEVPLLIRGEPGTGRAILARYVHLFGGSSGAALTFVPCAHLASSAELVEAVRSVSEGPSDRHRLSVCLEDVDRLPAAVQAELRQWIELGPPPGVLSASRLRWIATVGDDEEGELAAGLVPELGLALAGLGVRIPPLRERPEAIERIATETARAWGGVRGRGATELGVDAIAALQEHPWPGNVRELVAVVIRSVASGDGTPLAAEALRFEPAAPAPLAAGVEESPPREATPPRLVETPAEEAFEEEPAAEPVPLAVRPAETAAPTGLDAQGMRRLAQALAHELRNPLVAIRTFADLLPERFDDDEFRESFRRSVGDDVSRIEALTEHLAEFGRLAEEPVGQVDVAALLERLLQERRERIRERRLLVLRELDTAQPQARTRPGAMAFAFEAILEHVLARMPERGDLYLASKHHESALRGGPSLRVLLRFVRPRPRFGEEPIDREAARAVSAEATSLDLLLAELLVRGEGGTLTVTGESSDETVILVDLPAPAS